MDPVSARVVRLHAQLEGETRWLVALATAGYGLREAERWLAAWHGWPLGAAARCAYTPRMSRTCKQLR